MNAQAETAVQEAGPSADFIRTAVEQSNLNALRVALYQTTGDARFAAMSIERAPLNGGSSAATVLSTADRDAMIALATEYLSQPLATQAPPGDDQIRELVEMFAGREITEEELRFAIEQLSFADGCQTASWTANPPSADVRAKFHVLIIGAGFGGVAAAIQLSKLGIDYTMVDRQQDLGGTWLANQYPDVRVDIASHFYQFAFEKHYPWKHHFATGAEVRDYIEEIARKYDIPAHFRPGVEVTSAAWNEDDQLWDVTWIENGASRSVRANAVISAAGLFNRPHLPSIPGLDTFKGPKFHTTAWPRDLDISGKRIVVIGTGSTGAQLAPRIAKTAGHVTIFQRSPNWVAPVAGYHAEISDEMRWLLDHVPYYWTWYGFTFHWQSTQSLPGLQLHDPAWQSAGGIINERNDKLREFLTGYIREKLQGNEELIAKCVPDIAPWTRRMVMDNGWYDMLCRPNVDLVVCGVDHIEEDAVIASDGSRHPADIIVLSTGFSTDDYLWPVNYVGRNQLTLDKAWSKDGARAYLGLTMPGFPNLFILYGPNGQPRSGALPKWLEVWGRYAAQAIVTLIESGSSSVEVRPDVCENYNRKMDAEMKNIIWENAGKSSYYVNAFGRSSVNMPWTAEEYYKLSSAFNRDDYIIK